MKPLFLILLVAFSGLVYGLPGSAQNGIRTYVYQDTLGAGWEEWLWDTITVNYQNSSPVFAGSYSMAVTPGRGWTAWQSWNDMLVDTANYSLFTFAARGNKVNTWWEVQFLDSAGNSVSSNTYKFQPSNSQWQVHTIDLGQYGVAYKQIYALRFWYVTSDVLTSTLYLDEMGFGGAVPPSPTPAPTTASQSVTFSVNAANTINPFSQEMLGVAHGNWEHSWGKPFPGAVPGLDTIYKAAKVGLIRYAGGLWANWVGWERLPQRTPYGEYYPNSANYSPEFRDRVKTSTVYNFHYGTDEIDNLALLSQESGAQVMIQVNLSRNDPFMWADMVKYTNVEHNYHFKYWELGNEIDLECQQGATTCLDATTYQTRAAAYIAAMKAVDPTIIIVGGASASGHDIVANNWVDTPNMSRYLKAGLDAGANSLSYHWYTDCNATNYEDIFAYSWTTDTTAWQNAYSRSWSQIAPSRVNNEIIKSANLTQGITELNTDACDFNRAPQNSNHINALWYADVLGRLAYNGIDYVTWYQGYGNQGQGYPSVASTDDYPSDISQLYLRPSYYTTFIYGNYFGNTIVYSSDPDPTTVSLWASTDTRDHSQLKLMATNLHTATTTITVNLSGFTAASGEKYELTNPDPLNRTDNSNGPNHGSTINGYTLTTANIANAVNEIPKRPISIAGNSFTLSLAPYSVTAIILKNGSPRNYLPCLRR